MIAGIQYSCENTDNSSIVKRVDINGNQRSTEMRSSLEDNSKQVVKTKASSHLSYLSNKEVMEGGASAAALFRGSRMPPSNSNSSSLIPLLRSISNKGPGGQSVVGVMPKRILGQGGGIGGKRSFPTHLSTIQRAPQNHHLSLSRLK